MLSRSLLRPLRTPSPLLTSNRSLHLTPSLLSSTPPSSASSAANRPPVSRPGPPQLPPAQQREFEALQKAAQTVDLNIPEPEVHRDLRRSPKPDFEGEINPKTGEVGGPKKDPLMGNEWTYGGRATDF